MLEWEHFNEPSVLSVFLTMLLNADRGGETGITIGVISSLTRLHPNTVKRAIAKLVKSGEITRQKHGSKITTKITNWSQYQSVQKLDRCKDSSVQKLDRHRYKNSTDIGTKNVPIQYNKKDKNVEEVVVDDAHTHTHEEFVANALTDLTVERGCVAMRITRDEYRQLLTEVINDWEFRQLPDNEWTLTHLLAQMRIKHNINNQRNGNNQQTGDSIRAKLDQDAVKAMAALAAESRQPKIVPF